MSFYVGFQELSSGEVSQDNVEKALGAPLRSISTSKSNRLTASLSDGSILQPSLITAREREPVSFADKKASVEEIPRSPL